MKYYLVALFDNETYDFMEEVQRNLCRKYRINRNTPAFHITMEVVGNPDIDKLSKIINDIIKPYKKFKVQINGAICFNPPYKSLNLKVEGKGYIATLVRRINDTLKLHGFEVREDIHEWDYHVALASPNYAAKEWNTSEYSAAFESARKENIFKMAKVDRIELWKQVNNKKEMTVKTFSLREF
jgi:2'-5' RNA ligase